MLDTLQEALKETYGEKYIEINELRNNLLKRHDEVLEAIIKDMFYNDGSTILLLDEIEMIKKFLLRCSKPVVGIICNPMRVSISQLDDYVNSELFIKDTPLLVQESSIRLFNELKKDIVEFIKLYSMGADTPVRIIIAGSRTFDHFQYMMLRVYRYLNNLGLSRQSNFEIITGGASGADDYGHELTRIMGCQSVVMEADWDKYGKGAGHRRNADMAIYANEHNKGHCLIFWDGESKGSESMINMCERYGLTYEVYTDWSE